jgi:hypothetical protein
MPNYTFFCEEKNMTIEFTGTIEEMEAFEKQNPCCKWVPVAGLPTLDSVRLGIRKPDEGFRDLLRTVKRGSPRSTVNIP